MTALAALLKLRAVWIALAALGLFAMAFAVLLAWALCRMAKEADEMMERFDR